jgi:hypothetical protein
MGNLHFQRWLCQLIGVVLVCASLAYAQGIIGTVAGNGKAGFSGDGGPATSAPLGDPYEVAVDATGNLYVADLVNSVIREVATKAPFTVNHVIKFVPGTERQRAAFKKMATVRDIVDGNFVTADEDLNDDGTKEIIVMSQSSEWCGTGGCATMVLQKRPTAIVIIFNQLTFESLAVTNEKIGTYHALAVTDDKAESSSEISAALRCSVSSLSTR